MKKSEKYLFLIISIASLLLTFDFKELFSHNTDKDPSFNSPGLQGMGFLSKEYDVSVKEIELRIEEEHNLFLEKIIFVGVVLGCVFFSEEKILQLHSFIPRGESPTEVRKDEYKNKATLAVILVSCSWAAVAVAAVMDVRLMFNNIIIVEHGKWIRGVENIFFAGNTNAPGWEHFFNKHAIMLNPPHAAFLFTDRQLLTNILFIVALFLSFYLKEEKDNEHTGLFKAAAIGCLILIACPELYLGVQAIHIIVLFLGGISIYIWKIPEKSILKPLVHSIIKLVDRR